MGMYLLFFPKTVVIRNECGLLLAFLRALKHHKPQNDVSKLFSFSVGRPASSDAAKVHFRNVNPLGARVIAWVNALAGITKPLTQIADFVLRFGTGEVDMRMRLYDQPVQAGDH